MNIQAISNLKILWLKLSLVQVTSRNWKWLEFLMRGRRKYRVITLKSFRGNKKWICLRLNSKKEERTQDVENYSKIMIQGSLNLRARSHKSPWGLSDLSSPADLTWNPEVAALTLISDPQNSSRDLAPQTVSLRCSKFRPEPTLEKNRMTAVINLSKAFPRKNYSKYTIAISGHQQWEISEWSQEMSVNKAPILQEVRYLN
jgi:hypothetical protein